MHSDRVAITMSILKEFLQHPALYAGHSHRFLLTILNCWFTLKFYVWKSIMNQLDIFGLTQYFSTCMCLYVPNELSDGQLDLCMYSSEPRSLITIKVPLTLKKFFIYIQVNPPSNIKIHSIYIVCNQYLTEISRRNFVGSNFGASWSRRMLT